MDSDKVFAEMCENCHGQNGIGGEVKEAEPVGVHDITEEFIKRRAEPAEEEQCKEGVPSWSQLPSDGWEYPRALVRPRLRRPEEVKFLPQRLPGELGEEKQSLLAQRLKPQRLGRLRALACLRRHGGSGEGARKRWGRRRRRAAERCSLSAWEAEGSGGAFLGRNCKWRRWGNGPVSPAYKQGRRTLRLS